MCPGVEPPRKAGNSTYPSDMVECALRSRGAGATCYVISEAAGLDAKRLPLREALDRVIGYGMGTLLSCVPGKLAFYEGEGPSDRCILERRAI
jgi:hypothetical protein